MPKSTKQKLKLLYIIDILGRLSDEEHLLTASDIITELDRNGISAERKSIYDDIECLIDYGYDIVHIRGKAGGYFLGTREFELPELKLLVDAVQSCKFLTLKKSNELISKLERFTSKYSAKELNREIFVSNRVKTMNETIYINVDRLHAAMNENCDISFKYYYITREKKKEFRHNKKTYHVSPWSLLWDDENYYLVAYDTDEKAVKHFRVDKMMFITKTNLERSGKELFENFDQAQYSKQTFGMFKGETSLVTLKVKNHLSGVIVDRFGEDVLFRIIDDDYFECTVKVGVSSPFLSWVFQFDGDMMITSPESAREAISKMAKKFI